MSWGGGISLSGVVSSQSISGSLFPLPLPLVVLTLPLLPLPLPLPLLSLVLSLLTGVSGV